VVVELTIVEVPQIENYIAIAYCRSNHNNVPQYLFKIREKKVTPKSMHILTIKTKISEHDRDILKLRKRQH
jgi:hypothetical protein